MISCLSYSHHTKKLDSVFCCLLFFALAYFLDFLIATSPAEDCAGSYTNFILGVSPSLPELLICTSCMPMSTLSEVGGVPPRFCMVCAALLSRGHYGSRRRSVADIGLVVILCVWSLYYMPYCLQFGSLPDLALLPCYCTSVFDFLWL